MSLKNVSIDQISREVLELEASKITAKVSEEDKESSRFFEKFKLYWEVINPALRVVKVVSGKKVDAVIDELLLFGNRIADSDNLPDAQQTSEFLGKFCEVWGKIEFVLKIVMAFTGEKVDEVIREFIKLGNLVCAD